MCTQPDNIGLSKGYNKLIECTKGYKYLLNVVDIYSRYAWSFLIKTKKPSEIAPHIETVLKEVNPNKIWFTFDNGNEFKGDVKKLLNEKGAEIHLNHPNLLKVIEVLLVEIDPRTNG